MTAFLNTWNWKRILYLIVLPFAGFALLAYSTEAPFLIGVLNFILMGASLAIVIAFLPEVVNGFRADRDVTPEFIISTGIALSWFDWFQRGGISLAWRGAPSLRWIVDSDINSFVVFMTLLAAMCHLLAPQVINGRVPAKKWIRVGLIVGFSLLVALFAIYWRPISSTIRQSLLGDPPDSLRFTADADAGLIEDIKRSQAFTGYDDKGPYTTHLTAEVSQTLADRLEEWRSDQRPIPSKAAAIRRLLGEGLDAEDKALNPTQKK